MKDLSPAEFKKHVESLIQTREFRAARRLLVDRALTGSAFHEYPWLARQLAELSDDALPCRVAILSSVTFEGARDVLRAVALAQGFDPVLYFGGFQQFEQELMQRESGLIRHDPHILIFVWRFEDVCSTLAREVLELPDTVVEEEIRRVEARIGLLVEAGRSHLPKAALLVHTMVPPLWPALGVIDLGHPRGHHRVVDRVNGFLAKLAAGDSNVHLVDSSGLARRSGSAWFEARHWYSARAPFGPAAQVALAFEYVAFIRALTGKTKKVLVTDLDNTLWGGILGEDGADGIALGPEYPGNAFAAFQAELRQLGHRGVVLAINSKNNENEVREVFERHPHMLLRWNDFAAVRINWSDKATNLRELADELGLGLDTFVFVDDNPAELQMIHQELPEVALVEVPREVAELPGLLLRRGYFEARAFTDEDRRRTELYRAETKRAELKRTTPDLQGFYRSLRMRLHVAGPRPGDVPRLAQLTQRTNQFNMTTRRYTEVDIQRMIASPDHIVRPYRLEDCFGDNGVISLAIIQLEGDAARLDTLLMSCRVLGRTVEESILALLASEARGRGLKALIGEFIPTRKNTMAKDFFEKNGFARIGESPQGIFWRLDLEGTCPSIPDWVQVIDQDQ